ncbi:MAG: hypothetical protein AAGF56_08590 [Pseudomonadota bacterium]
MPKTSATIRQAATATAFLMLLPACLGGASGTATDDTQGAMPPDLTMPDPIVPDRYQTLDSTVPVTSDLIGTAFRDASGPRQLVAINGTLTHDTRAVVVSDGFNTLTDPDGPDEGGFLRDGALRMSLGRTGSTLGTNIAVGFDYVTLFQFDDTNFPAVSNTVGVIGIGTELADMPISGGATYLGKSTATFSSVNGVSNFGSLNSGTSTVVVSFRDRTVDVTVGNFADSDLFGRIDDVPFDQMKATGMLINGNGFAGGTLAITLDGAPVDLLPDTAVDSAEGYFFGFDEAEGIPDEVGGVLLRSAGALPHITATFLAD